MASKTYPVPATISEGSNSPISSIDEYRQAWMRAMQDPDGFWLIVTRIFTTLLYEMTRRDARRGLATLCIGGGMGIAICVERDR